MNPDFLPALHRPLRALGAYAERHEVNDQALAEICAEVDRARQLVAQARGARWANACTGHPGGPVDPTTPKGCLLCGTQERRPGRPLPNDFAPSEVLRFLHALGQDAGTRRYGAQAVTRALVTAHRRLSTPRPAVPAGHTTTPKERSDAQHAR
ncbi:hypothetical protein [Actinacidiphila acididurans]|uniref:Uncharacterized protein n=1 Tax=Actinacidiphila acididurans TaxID=2784346 RepID=A0ABS2TTR2_9ACTN|nr:hypothetical protein [Actinacidiphila acididurans]MBM9506733.1 hypothetical protein [Actinacidiphila acididurans]